MKERILKQGGKWLITYNDKSKYVLDLDNMLFDNYEWYKLDEMQGEITLEDLDKVFKDIRSIKRLENK